MTTVVDAQFIRFNIQIPSSFDITDRANSPKIIEPPKGTARNINAELQGLRWIEFRANENLEFSIQIKWSSTYGKPISEKSYFLNDGSLNFSDAFMLSSGINTVSMHNGGKLINEMPNNPKHLSAWLGLSSTRIGTLTIIYQ